MLRSVHFQATAMGAEGLECIRAPGMDGNIPAGLEPERTVEVVLEAVELGATNPFHDHDEMVVRLVVFLLFSVKQLVGNDDDHTVLAGAISETRVDEYVCDSNVDEECSFVLLGHDASAVSAPVPRYRKSCIENNFYGLLSTV